MIRECSSCVSAGFSQVYCSVNYNLSAKPRCERLLLYNFYRLKIQRGFFLLQEYYSSGFHARFFSVMQYVVKTPLRHKQGVNIASNPTMNATFLNYDF